MRFRLRLLISICLLIAVTFGAGGTLLISTSFQASLSEEREAALQTYETVRGTLHLLNTLGGKMDYEVLREALVRMEQQGPARWQAISLQSEEETLYRSGSEELLAWPLAVPEAGKCAYTEELEEGETPKCSLLVASSISAGEDRLVLRASFDLSAAYRTRRMQQRLYLAVYVIVVLLGFLMAAILSFALTGQLRKLTAAVRQISEGDLSRRSGIHTQDEFGQLSRDFDAMADKLQSNIRELEEDVRRKEAFMGAFAHELKTPMTSIIGYADLLRQDALEGKDRTAAAGYIYSEGQRLEKLSFQLLELLLVARDGVEMQQVSLPGLLTDVYRAMEPVLRRKNIRLVCRSGKGTAELAPELVKSLLYNLIDNGAKAFDGPGTIAVDGEVLPGGCRIRVIDHGRGMEEKELSQITEAFYRVDKARSRNQGGAGLGLALCSKIVELHHGSLDFYSQVGVGTCVTVTLYGRGEDGHAKA